MDNFFTHTLADLSFDHVKEENGEDENPFIDDLFNDRLTDVGHIQLIPVQNRLRITASVGNEEHKTYDIITPRLEFLKFIFKHTNPKVKRALHFYYKNSPDARAQHRESKD